MIRRPNRIPWGLLLTGIVAALPMFPTAVSAATTYEDLSGRFVIDLPDAGWKLEPQKEESVFVFKSGSNSIILQFDPDERSREALFSEGLNAMRVSGMPDAEPEDKIRNLTVNGNEARWGTFAQSMKMGKIEIVLRALLGSVSLEEGGIFFLSIASKNSIATLEGALQKSFQSIRNPGQAPSGAGEVELVAADVEELTGGEPLAFRHERLSLDLPAGWNEKQRGRDFEEEVVGWFMSDRILGGTLLVICDRGMGLSRKKVHKAATITVNASMPDARMVEDYELDEGKESISVIVYHGTSVAEGSEVPMTAVNAVRKTAKCWVNMIGLSHRDGTSQLQDSVAEIARTAR